MITFEEAEKIALDRIPADCVLIKDSIIEKPFGWYFMYQTTAFVETGDVMRMQVGSGGFIVEKEGGKVIEFSSAYSTEKNLTIYERGLIGLSDLVVLKVRDLLEAVRLLNRLSMTRMETELANGIEWKIPKHYQENQLKEALSKLPCVFKNQNFYFRYDEFEKIDKSKCIDYELRKVKRNEKS